MWENKSNSIYFYTCNCINIVLWVLILFVDIIYYWYSIFHRCLFPNHTSWLLLMRYYSVHNVFYGIYGQKNLFDDIHISYYILYVLHIYMGLHGSYTGSTTWPVQINISGNVESSIVICRFYVPLRLVRIYWSICL